jgi:hypothetical protein
MWDIAPVGRADANTGRPFDLTNLTLRTEEYRGNELVLLAAQPTRWNREKDNQRDLWNFSIVHVITLFDPPPLESAA